MQEDETLAKIPIVKNKDESIIVSKRKYRGKLFYDVRLWYLDGQGNLIPTKKGVTVPAGLKEKLVDALNDIDKNKGEADNGR